MSGNLSFPTGVQERLSGWTRIQEALKAKASGKPMVRPTVTISRQFGCEGFPLSLRLQDLFQKATGEPWSVLDRALLEAVAREEHVPMELLEHLESRSRYLEAYGFHPRGALTGDEAFAKLAVSLLHFARAGNAIINRPGRRHPVPEAEKLLPLPARGQPGMADRLPGPAPGDQPRGGGGPGEARVQGPGPVRAGQPGGRRRRPGPLRRRFQQ